jgi:hypothetical protein
MFALQLTLALVAATGWAAIQEQVYSGPVGVKPPCAVSRSWPMTIPFSNVIVFFRSRLWSNQISSSCVT